MNDALSPEHAAGRVIEALYALDATLRANPDLPQERLVATLALLDRSGAGHDPGASQTLGSLLSDLKKRLGSQLSYHQTLVVEGHGVLQQTKSSRAYAWTDGRMLAHRIAAMAADAREVDPETGEVLPVPPGAVASRVCDALIECGGLDTRSAGWRSEPLKARGIDPNDFREVTNPGTPGVRWMD